MKKRGIIFIILFFIFLFSIIKVNAVCQDIGLICKKNSDCCSNICSNSWQCVQSCKTSGSCSDSKECCRGYLCSGGECKKFCKTSGSCFADGECCSGTCDANGQCACKTSGLICIYDTECCSGTCDANGKCTSLSCLGCIYSGACYTGTENTKCGSEGNTCVDCTLTGKTCSSKQCVSTSTNNDVTPAMISNTAPSPNVVSASSEYSSNLAYKAFDHDSTTRWQSGATGTQWIKFDFSSGNTKKITQYTLYCNTDCLYAPTSWNFQGSNDNIQWTILDSQTSKTWTNNEIKVYTFSNTNSYRYYRLIWSSNNNNLLSEIAMMELQQTTCITGYKCYNSTSKGYQNLDCSWSNLQFCGSTKTCSAGDCITSASCTCSSFGLDNKPCAKWTVLCDNSAIDLTCGTCPKGQTCSSNGQCIVSTCIPDCTGRFCGDNGCGGSCGTCVINNLQSGACDKAGQCVTSCTPNCVRKFCGPDGCGGSCGTCFTGTCSNGQCVTSCTPKTVADCAKEGWVCGYMPDGCGGQVNCGKCMCENGPCETFNYKIMNSQTDQTKKSVYNIGDSITNYWSNLPQYAYSSSSNCKVYFWYYGNVISNDKQFYVNCGDSGLGSYNQVKYDTGTLTSEHCFGKTGQVTNTIQMIIKDNQNSIIALSNNDSFTINCSQNGLTEIRFETCKLAEDNNNCNSLQDIGIVTKEQCCSYLNMCCTSNINIISITEFYTVFINAIKDYLTNPSNAKLNLNEIKDLVVAYLSVPKDTKTIDLSSIGSFSKEKLIDIYNKAKGTTSSTFNYKIMNSQTDQTKKSVYNIGDSITNYWSNLPQYAYSSSSNCKVYFWYYNVISDDKQFYVPCGDSGLGTYNQVKYDTGTLTSEHCFGKTGQVTNTIQMIIKNNTNNVLAQSNSDSYTINCPTTPTPHVEGEILPWDITYRQVQLTANVKKTYILHVEPKSITYGQASFISLDPNTEFNFIFTLPPGVFYVLQPGKSSFSGHIAYGILDLPFDANVFTPVPADGFVPAGDYILEITLSDNPLPSRIVITTGYY